MEHYSLKELRKLAQDRLRPSITNPNYLVLRKRAQLITAWMEQIPGENLRVLDVGGRYQPYRPLIQARVPAIRGDRCSAYASRGCCRRG